jgi:hypothetical protein
VGFEEFPTFCRKRYVDRFGSETTKDSESFIVEVCICGVLENVDVVETEVPALERRVVGMHQNACGTVR